MTNPTPTTPATPQPTVLYVHTPDWLHVIVGFAVGVAFTLAAGGLARRWQPNPHASVCPDHAGAVITGAEVAP